MAEMDEIIAALDNEEDGIETVEALLKKME